MRGATSYRRREVILIRPAELRAMTLQRLDAFLEQHRDWIEAKEWNNCTCRVMAKTMYDIVSHIIKPSTLQTNCSFAELGPPQALQFFVSHWWGEEFTCFMQSLRHFALKMSRSDPAFWICSFANNQHSVNLGTSLEASPFNLALKAPSCEGVVMVLDTQLTPFKRIWCLYEVLRLHVLQKPLDLATENGCLTKCRAEDFDHSQNVHLKADLLLLGERMFHVSVEESLASKASDRASILKEIDAVVGREQLNATIGALLSQVTLSIMKGGRIIAPNASLFREAELFRRASEAVAWSSDDPAGLRRRTSLHTAAQRGDVEGIRQHIAEINMLDTLGRAPLHYAAWYSTPNSVEELLRAHANPDDRDDFGATPLILAARGGNHEAISQLLFSRAEIGVVDVQGWTAPHWAAVFGNQEVLAFLLSVRSNADSIDVNNESPLHAAAWGGFDTVALQLLEARASPDGRSLAWTPLHVAARGGHAEVVALLLKAKAQVMASSAVGETPLHFAATGRHTSVVSHLLAARAQTDAVNQRNQTPLERAQVIWNDSDLLELSRVFGSVESASSPPSSPKILLSH